MNSFSRVSSNNEDLKNPVLKFDNLASDELATIS